MARHALLADGDSVLVAVSGGVDSMVLLRVLAGLAPAHRWRLHVAHLNHGLRGRSSDADARLVAKVARQLKLPATVRRAEVQGLARRRGISIEMAARAVRHEFLARVARQHGIRTIVLAHHLDDQVELFFLRLLRGSGGEGLAGMKWKSSSPADARLRLVRPLRDQPKSALVTYARKFLVPFREDASNTSRAIPRNRLRHELLPLLRRQYQPGLDQVVARTMELLGADAEAVTQWARQWQAEGRPGKRKREKFQDLPIAVQRRVLQMELRRLKQVPTFELVEALRSGTAPVALPDSASGSSPDGKGRGVSSPARRPTRKERKTGARFAQHNEKGRVTIHRAGTWFSSDSLRAGTGEPGKAEFGGAEVKWAIVHKKGTQRLARAREVEYFDADRIGDQVVLRHWQPGDRFQPIGMRQAVKVQDLFVNQKIPRNRRHQSLLAATATGEIFWVEGLRIAERFKLTEATINRLEWSWKRS